MNKKFANLEFLKAHLPEHLHPYCRFLTYVITNRVSWLEAEQKEFALLVCMAALDKAWKKRQENPQAYTEAQFCSYVKKSVDGTILTQFKDAIETRQAQLDDYRQQQETSERILREEKEEIEAVRRKHDEELPASPHFALPALASLGNLLRFQNREEQEKHYEAILGSWETASERISIEEQVKEEDADGATQVIINKLLLLLPKRERKMIFCSNIALRSEDWGISRARGQQIKKAAEERLGHYVARLKSGDKYVDLLAESQKAQEIATKKEMAGKDAKTEREFQEFCRKQSLDELTVCARTFFDTYKKWWNREPEAEANYQAFCREEEYEPDTAESENAYLYHLRDIHYFQDIRYSDNINRIF